MLYLGKVGIQYRFIVEGVEHTSLPRPWTGEHAHHTTSGQGTSLESVHFKSVVVKMEATGRTEPEGYNNRSHSSYNKHLSSDRERAVRSVEHPEELRVRVIAF